MKVLVICDVLSPQTVGGAGRFAREVTEALKKRGTEVQFLTRRVSNNLSRNHANDIKTTYYPLPLKAFPNRFRKIFNQAIRDFKPDLVHVHQPLPAFLLIPSSFSPPIFSYQSWKTRRPQSRCRLPGHQVPYGRGTHSCAQPGQECFPKDAVDSTHRGQEFSNSSGQGLGLLFRQLFSSYKA